MIRRLLIYAGKSLAVAAFVTPEPFRRRLLHASGRMMAAALSLDLPVPTRPNQEM